MSLPALSESEYQELERKFSCSVCTEFFNDPVTSCCGHTFCRVCLDRVWKTSPRQAKCPICRERLNSNVSLCRNVVLVNVMRLLSFNTADGTDSPDGNRNVVATDAAAMSAAAMSVAAMRAAATSASTTSAAATSAAATSTVAMSPVAMDTVNSILMEWLPTSAVGISTIQQLHSLYGCNVFLDINSVSPHLKLCDDDRTAEVTTKRQTYPEHPDRFKDCSQVLAKDGFSRGIKYWEVDIGETWCRVGVTYRSIKRTGQDADGILGRNPVSWCLILRRNQCAAWHNGIQTLLEIACAPKRLGFLLNYEKGDLLVLNVMENMAILHRFQCNFTQPLYPAVRVWAIGDSVTFPMLR